MGTQEEFKKKAAHRAVEFITSQMVIGLGTGSTAKFALERIGERLRDGTLENISGIPSSGQTAKLARDMAIPLTRLDEHPVVDLNIDGADEVDPELNLIKGGGGALLREKIIAQASRRNIIIVDDSKLSSQLGKLYSLPVEIIPMARKTEEIYLKSLGAKVTLRTDKEGRPYQTDQKNLILDAEFGPITNPSELAHGLNQRAGIVEHGLFIGLADEVIVAGKNGIEHLKRKD
jgi:ribose 5-phosphate isomerase A